MSFEYPSHRTGTAQDLMRVVTLSAEKELARTGRRMPVKGAAARSLLEPVARLAGVAASAIMEVLPADWSVAFHDRLFAGLSAPHRYPFNPEAPELRAARDLAAAAERRAGRAPALLALISHPPVDGELAHLNFALVGRATVALRAVRGRPCRPRLVTATDPFALDAISILSEGLYAGFMGTFHVGIDRLSLGTGFIGPTLTPWSSWTEMPRRLFRLLRRGGEAGLVLSGGVPQTGRVLYGAREWAAEIWARSPLRGRSAEAARALRAAPEFSRFESAAGLPRPPGARRLVEMWLMCAAAGLVPEQDAVAAGRAALAALAVPETEHPALLAELAADMARETPRRRRLFRLLAGRVARRRPLVLVPIMHGVAPPSVTVGEAWSWEYVADGRLLARRAGAPDDARETAPDAFAVRFVEENFR